MAKEKERKIKGSILTGYEKYIRKKWGSNGLEDCKKATGIDLTTVQDETWYRHMSSVDVLDWMKDTYGLDYCRLAGKSIVTDKGIVSFAARIAGIDRVLDRGMEEYRQSLNYGDIEIHKEDKKAEITLIDVLVHDSDMQTWVGVFEGILEVTKKDGKVEFKKEGDRCTYTLTWK